MKFWRKYPECEASRAMTLLQGGHKPPIVLADAVKVTTTIDPKTWVIKYAADFKDGSNLYGDAHVEYLSPRPDE